jgi:hypothetical protein
MFRDIAQGIGDAARLIPEHSRSGVGALAVHRANVEVSFELSTQARDESGTVGLGARTFIFGPSIATGSNESTALNTGRITLEIVAITEPEERGKDPLPEPDPPLTAEAIRKEIHRMGMLLAEAPIPDEDRRSVTALLERASQHLGAGELDAARAILARLAPAFDALSAATAETTARSSAEASAVPASASASKKTKKTGKKA